MSSTKDIGIFKKYNVTRTDGKPVRWCFVLEDKDPVTPEALRFLAVKYMAMGYDELSNDLCARATIIEEGQEMPPLESEEQIRARTEGQRARHARMIEDMERAQLTRLKNKYEGGAR